MLLESMKKVWDAIQVNLPLGGAFAVVSLTEWEILFRIGAIIIGAVCTIIVTRHKTKKKDKDE